MFDVIFYKGLFLALLLKISSKFCKSLKKSICYTFQIQFEVNSATCGRGKEKDQQIFTLARRR